MIVAVAIGHELWRALSFAFGMTWEVLWALILGFALSGAVQAVVSKREMRRLLPDDSPKTLAIACARQITRCKAKYLITRRQFDANQIAHTWDLEDGCGGA